VEAVVDKAEPRRPGEILAAERERQGLGASDIAQRLHMSVSQVDALERGEYERLPRGPFLRGFVRNYAKTLGLAPDDVLSVLREGGPRDSVPRIVVPTQNIRFDPLSERIGSPYVKAAAIAGAIIAFGFATLYWWFYVRNVPPGTPRKPAAESVPGTSAPARTVPAPAATPAVPAPGPTSAPALEPLKAESPVVSLPSKPSAPSLAATKTVAVPKAERVSAANAAEARLKLRFRGPSWVEIKDASGRVLMTGLNDSGSEAQVSGVRPLRVIVGNAHQVQLYLDDRSVDLEPHTREAVARVTLE
jgi:cytoskeleton protein RodZ